MKSDPIHCFEFCLYPLMCYERIDVGWCSSNSCCCCCFLAQRSPKRQTRKMAWRRIWKEEVRQRGREEEKKKIKRGCCERKKKEEELEAAFAFWTGPDAAYVVARLHPGPAPIHPGSSNCQQCELFQIAKTQTVKK